MSDVSGRKVKTDGAQGCKIHLGGIRTAHVVRRCVIAQKFRCGPLDCLCMRTVSRR